MNDQVQNFEDVVTIPIAAEEILAVELSAPSGDIELECDNPDNPGPMCQSCT